MLRLLAYLALLVAIPVSHAASPVNLCSTAKTGDRAPACSVAITCAVPTQANDMVRTVVAGVQVWEPYSTLTVGSSVVDCSHGATWSSLAITGIPLFSSLPPPVTTPPVITPPPVVTPPVVTPPPPPVMVSVTIKPTSASDPPQASVVYSSLPAGACFSLSDGTHTTQACLPQ